MNPETIQKLLVLPEFKEFCAFIAAEAEKLNSVSDIEIDGQLPVVVAVQVQARQQAYKVIQRMLAPLLNVQGKTASGPTTKEYEM